MPIGFCTSMWTAKNHRLLPSAFQNAEDQRGSPNRVRKFCSPTKAVPLSVAVNSDRFSVLNSGRIMIAL